MNYSRLTENKATQADMKLPAENTPASGGKHRVSQKPLLLIIAAFILMISGACAYWYFRDAPFRLSPGDEWTYEVRNRGDRDNEEISLRVTDNGETSHSYKLSLTLVKEGRRADTAEAVISVTKGGIQLIKADKETLTHPLPELKLPLKANDSWSVCYERDKMAVVEVGATESIGVPAGLFKCTRVVCKDQRGTGGCTLWFNNKVGIVRFEGWNHSPKNVEAKAELKRTNR